MATRVLKEASGNAVFVGNFAVKPAASGTITSLNYAPVSIACDLLDTVTDIHNAMQYSSKDYKTMCDAIKQIVIDVGVANPVGAMTDEEAGMDYLIANDNASAVIAAQYGVGLPYQIVTVYPVNTVRDTILGDNVRQIFEALKRRAFDFWAFIKSRAPFSIVGVPFQDLVQKDLNISGAAADELEGSLIQSYYLGFNFGRVNTGYDAGTYTGVLDYFNATAGTRYVAPNDFISLYGAEVEQPSVINTGGGAWVSFKNALYNLLAYGQLDIITYA